MAKKKSKSNFYKNIEVKNILRNILILNP